MVPNAIPLERQLKFDFKFSLRIAFMSLQCTIQLLQFSKSLCMVIKLTHTLAHQTKDDLANKITDTHTHAHIQRLAHQYNRTTGSCFETQNKIYILLNEFYWNWNWSERHPSAETSSIVHYSQCPLLCISITFVRDAILNFCRHLIRKSMNEKLSCCSLPFIVYFAWLNFHANNLLGQKTDALHCCDNARNG